MRRGPRGGLRRYGKGAGSALGLAPPGAREAKFPSRPGTRRRRVGPWHPPIGRGLEASSQTSSRGREGVPPGEQRSRAAEPVVPPDSGGGGGGACVRGGG